MQDVLKMNMGYDLGDSWSSSLFRNNSAKRNGKVNRSRTIKSFNDAFNFVNLNLTFTDKLVISDQYVTVARHTAEEQINMDDIFSLIHGTGTAVKENLNITEEFIAGKRYQYFRDGVRMRNSSITRKGMVFIPLE